MARKDVVNGRKEDRKLGALGEGRTGILARAVSVAGNAVSDCDLRNAREKVMSNGSHLYEKVFRL
jgi:hypothetical protein